MQDTERQQSLLSLTAIIGGLEMNTRGLGGVFSRTREKALSRSVLTRRAGSVTGFSTSQQARSVTVSPETTHAPPVVASRASPWPRI